MSRNTCCELDINEDYETVKLGSIFKYEKKAKESHLLEMKLESITFTHRVIMLKNAMKQIIMKNVLLSSTI